MLASAFRWSTVTALVAAVGVPGVRVVASNDKPVGTRNAVRQVSRTTRSLRQHQIGNRRPSGVRRRWQRPQQKKTPVLYPQGRPSTSFPSACGDLTSLVSLSLIVQSLIGVIVIDRRPRPSRAESSAGAVLPYSHRASLPYHHLTSPATSSSMAMTHRRTPARPINVTTTSVGPASSLIAVGFTVSKIFASSSITIFTSSSVTIVMVKVSVSVASRQPSIAPSVAAVGVPASVRVDQTTSPPADPRSSARVPPESAIGPNDVCLVSDTFAAKENALPPPASRYIRNTPLSA